MMAISKFAGIKGLIKIDKIRANAVRILTGISFPAKSGIPRKKSPFLKKRAPKQLFHQLQWSLSHRWDQIKH